MKTFLSFTWCNLDWSDWLPLESMIGQVSPAQTAALPAAPGFYRLRPSGQDSLAYLDYTTNLRRRLLGELAPNVLAKQMPFTDPHPAAPCLWAWRQAEGPERLLNYEASFSLADLDRGEREARLCYLLWQYRLERGESPHCSLGRFHPDFSRSTNRKGSIRGERRFPDEPPNPAGGPSLPPLRPQGQFNDPDWLGLPWSQFYYLKKELGNAPGEPGVFRLMKPAGPELLLLGEAEDLRLRLSNLAERDWGPLDPLYSYAGLPGSLPHQRHEVENDLIGAFYAEGGRLPILQFEKR